MESLCVSYFPVLGDFYMHAVWTLEWVNLYWVLFKHKYRGKFYLRDLPRKDKAGLLDQHYCSCKWLKMGVLPWYELTELNRCAAYLNCWMQGENSKCHQHLFSENLAARKAIKKIKSTEARNTWNHYVSVGFVVWGWFFFFWFVFKDMSQCFIFLCKQLCVYVPQI